MNSYVLSDNNDTLVGMRLAGIEGKKVSTHDNALAELKELVKNEEIGIIFITEKVADLIEEEILIQQNRQMFPLITIIPDRHGFSHHKAITHYIDEAVGI